MHTEVEGQRSEETLCSQFSPPHALPRDRPQVMSTAGQVPLLAAPSHWPGECIVKDWFQRCSPGTAPGLLLMRLQNQFRFLIPSYSKFPQQPALEQTLALTQTSLLLAFVFSDYPRLSEYQDKITDNQGLENNQAVGIETVIVHPGRPSRTGETWAQRIGTGYTNGEVTKSQQSKAGETRRQKEPPVKPAYTMWQPRWWQRPHSS